MSDTTVKYFDSTFSGAPELSSTTGTLINVLNACLVDGFGSVTLNSLVVSSNVATGTVSTGHYFTMVGNTGPVITIAGATPNGLNGTWRIASIPNSTTFTFSTTGISDQTATGTITAKRSPAGFSIKFSETNKAVYQSIDPTSTGCCLRVDDTTSSSAATIGYESMSDMNTGTGPFPATSNYGFYRSNSDVKPWTLIADSKLFYLYVEHNSSYYFTLQCFGDFVSLAGLDVFNCMLGRGVAGAGGTAFSAGSPNTNLFYVKDPNAGNECIVIPRNYTQQGSAILASMFPPCIFANSTIGRSQFNVNFPDTITNKLIINPLTIYESNGIRGVMPGYYAPINNFYNRLDCQKTICRVQINGVNKDIMIFITDGKNGGVCFDITGPWR